MSLSSRNPGVNLYFKGASMLPNNLEFNPDEVYDFSPPVNVEPLPCGSQSILVVRDDLLPGGSKQRGCGPYLRLKAAAGIEEFVYASPFSGFAQIALAAGCRTLGLRCVVFTSPDPDNPGHLHEFSRVAQSYGAKLELCASFAQAQTCAQRHAARSRRALEVPLGFNDPDFNHAYQTALANAWQEIKTAQPSTITRMWLPVGSGTLLKNFRALLGERFPIVAVDVGVLPEHDPRILAAKKWATLYYRAPEFFEEKALAPPAIPSNLFYDAKLWQFLAREARPGDLWWNVAQ